MEVPDDAEVHIAVDIDGEKIIPLNGGPLSPTTACHVSTVFTGA
jgi:hypothetical protein